MANNNATHLSLVSDHSNAPAAMPPAAQSPETPIEIEIGQAMVNAVSALCRAGTELQRGGLITAATKREGAQRIHRIRELRRNLPETEFVAVANRECRRQLARHLADDADFCRDQRAQSVGEVLITNFINEILEAVDWVCRFEREMMH